MSITGIDPRKGVAVHSSILPTPSGTYISPNSLIFGTQATVALTANRLYAMPFYVAKTRTFTEVAINVATAVASSRARAAIYDLTVDGLPNALLLDAAEFDTASTGEKTGAISLTLTGGRIYFASLHSDGAIGVTGLSSAVTSVLGRATPSGTQRNVAYRNVAYAAAPASFGTPDAYQASAYLVLLK